MQLALRLTAAILLLSPALDAASAPSASSSLSGKEYYALSDDDRIHLEHEALHGSCEAADRLYAFHALYISNQKEAMYWQQIAAENGDPTAQSGLATLMSDDVKHDPTTTKTELARDKERADFWYKKSLIHPPLGVGIPHCSQDRK